MKMSVQGTSNEKAKQQAKTDEENNNQNSLLSDLFNNEYIGAVYNLCTVILIILAVDSFTGDYFANKKITIGLELIVSQFRNVHLVILGWISLYVLFCLTFVAFNIWAKVRIALIPNTKLIKIWDTIWISIIVSYYVFSFIYAAKIKLFLKLQPAESMFILMEQPRLLMKTHSFIRNNVPKVIKYKPHTEEILSLPTFQHFAYFSFAPTLIYKDKYPRTKEIRWKVVGSYLLEIIGLIFFNSLIYEKLLFSFIGDFGLRKYSKGELILAVIRSSTAGAFLMLSQFYLILHTWQNFFAEILRFGDRGFYKAWWLCTSYEEYYRTWNVIVHNWLVHYIYKDFKFVISSKLLRKLLVFFISAIVHEWVLTFAFNFHMPLLFFEFFVMGVMFTGIKPPKTSFYNILFLYGIFLGFGSLLCLYGVEYYARKHVPAVNETLKEFLIPRFLTCDCIT